MNKIRNYGKESENMDDVSRRKKRNKYDDLHSELRILISHSKIEYYQKKESRLLPIKSTFRYCNIGVLKKRSRFAMSWASRSSPTFLSPMAFWQENTPLTHFHPFQSL